MSLATADRIESVLRSAEKLRRRFPLEVIERLASEEQAAVDFHDFVWLHMEACANLRGFAGMGAKSLLNVREMNQSGDFDDHVLNYSSEMIHPDRVPSAFKAAGRSLFGEDESSSRDTLTGIAGMISVSLVQQALHSALPHLDEGLLHFQEKLKTLKFSPSPEIHAKLAEGIARLRMKISKELQARAQHERIATEAEAVEG